MNHDAAMLDSQLLTPERVQWIFDIGESTEADWRKRKVIAHFKQGRIVRYTPESVLEAIVRNTRKARGNPECGIRSAELADALFADVRFARLIELTVAARLERKLAA